MNTLPPTHPPLAPPALAPSAARRAFTLIEVLVVISIIVILLAVSIPTIRALTKGNNEKQAVNLVTSLIANARATALRNHALAGVVFYEDPASKGRDAAQLVVRTRTAGLVAYFSRAPNTTYQLMPPGIKVATLDDATASGDLTQFKTESANGSSIQCRLILFDANGQLTTRKNLDTDTVPSGTDQTVKDSIHAWGITVSAEAATSSSPAISSNATGSPAVLVYDDGALSAAIQGGQVTNSSTLDNWLAQHGDIIVINAYTGSVIR